MPSFISDEELERYLGEADTRAVVEKADAFVRDLSAQLETVKAQANAASITAEQTCSFLEQKYISLTAEYADLESRNSQISADLEQRVSELASVQAEKHRLHLQAIEKDGNIERLSVEVSELHKSKRQLMELVEHKDAEISETKNTAKSYLDKIIKLTETAGQREARINDIEADLAHSRATSEHLSQEKELIERHNVWLNDELMGKVDSLSELRKRNAELEADLSAKMVNAEKDLKECSSSLKWYKERVTELEMKLQSSQQELSTAKDAAVATEEQYSSEIATVSKLVDLYKESSEEWSKKAGELEGVIKALETHLSQTESEYKVNLEKEVSLRKEAEKEAAELKEKLAKCEAEIESSRKASELNIVPFSSFATEVWKDSFDDTDVAGDSRILVPNVPAGISGTALAASLLRDGWSLAKMYAKYQETVDALRHEQLGRKQSQAILERVLFEIEEKASLILDERAEHEKMAEAYSQMDLKLQQSLSEQAKSEKVIKELKAELKRRERDYNVAQKEVMDLQRQVTFLLKECQDVQLRYGSVDHESPDDMIAPFMDMVSESDVQKVISEQLLTFKDINELVDQNVKLRSLVRSLSDQIDHREQELKEQFELELQKHNEEAASKISTVLERAEEQGQMIESLHSSVAMYKRLYEEQHKLRSLNPSSVVTAPEDGRKDLMLLLEGSQQTLQETTKKVQEQASERVKRLEEEVASCRSKITSLRSERDKLALEANFAQERLERFMKEFDHQREESNGILARNVEFSQLIVDYQRKLRESSESLVAAEEVSQKLTMEVAVLKHEKELLLKSEKRAFDEVRDLTERVHRLQASLDTIQSTEEVREEARAAEKMKQDEYITKIESEWAEAKKELQHERDNVRILSLDREHTIKDAMRQVEEMGKELASTMHALTAAEARASVAEARCSDLERKLKSFVPKVAEKDGGYEPSSSSTSEIIRDLCMAREEIERLKEEVQANKDHMLQYKSIAEVNEAALKQMENAHENFKIEAERLRKSLEAEVVSLRDQVSVLEHESSLKSSEAASAATEKEEAFVSALAEIAKLKEEKTTKIAQIVSMEVQMDALREDLQREHQRWRVARENYERQVILQSETIQELTKTSETLVSLQEEASELRRLVDSYKCENEEEIVAVYAERQFKKVHSNKDSLNLLMHDTSNMNDLRTKWEAEKVALEKSKNEAERKYKEINEQNKILHDRLEAMHIKVAEKDCSSAGIGSTSTLLESEANGGLQNVISYLRRSKEIAETEISLLKQEKLRLQSQLERALKEAEAAQAALSAEHANSRNFLFIEDEFKSLKVQVREMNLLRESNMQLREENKHNFEECQKLREVAHKAKIETENLLTQLKEKEIEVEAVRKEIEMERSETQHLKKRISEMLERSRVIDAADYDRVKSELQQMQINMAEKDARIEEILKLAAEKEEVIGKLQQDFAGTRSELNEKENRILQVEALLKAEQEKQKRFAAQMKRRVELLVREKESLLKEKDELSKENQALSKQLEDSREGKKPMGDAATEQSLKDARIQLLEKMLEKQREEYRKEKEKRQNIEKAIMTKVANVDQERRKVEDEQEKHKEAVRKISTDLEKLKQARESLPEGTSVIQLLSGNLLDDLASAYVQAVENFERSAQLVLIELGSQAPPSTSSAADTTAAAGAGPVLPVQVPAVTPLVPAKTTEEREKKASLPKGTTETRKMGRKLVRPRLVKSEESQGDAEMSEMESGRTASGPDMESQSLEPAIRKRLALSSSEPHEESVQQAETGLDVTAPAPKKSRVSEFVQEEARGQSTPENVDAAHVLFDEAGILPQDMHEETADVEKDDAETTQEQADEPSVLQELDNMDQVGLSNNNILMEENVDKSSGTDLMVDEWLKSPVEQEPAVANAGEREEGELAQEDLDGEVEIADMIGSHNIVESQPELTGTTFSPSRVDLPSVVEDVIEVVPEDSTAEKIEEGEVMDDVAEGSEKPNNVNNDPSVGDIDPASEAAVTLSAAEGTIAAASETNPSREASSSVASAAGEVKEVSPAATSSTTINLRERATQRSMERLGITPSTPVRGRGRPMTRGRAMRGRGRRQTSGNQG